MYPTSDRQSELLEELLLAIPQNQFILYYQPVVNLLTNQIISFEALIRWHHPTMGLLLPGEFLGLALEIGLGQEICEWVIRTSISQAMEWKKINPSIKIACNVEQSDIQSGFLLSAMTRAFDELKAENGIKIEIVERGLDASSDNWISSLEFMESQLITLLIDDTFTEDANLRSIRDLRNKTDRIEMKIDKSFIDGLRLYDPGEEEYLINQAAVEVILFCGTAMGIPTIAEGVETQQQADWLRERGCFAAQGYLFARPLPAIAATELLTQQNFMNQTKESS